PPLWAVLSLSWLRSGSTIDLQPQLASITFATNNPTLTTVALEKPLCMFDSREPLTGTCKVYLYVMVDSASSRNTSVQDSNKSPLRSTFWQTMGGRTRPYRAAAFDLTPCGDLPSLDTVGDVNQAAEILDVYLVRVGDNGTCLRDPNFRGLCNPPLSAATAYRFQYVLVNMSMGLVQDKSLWLGPIHTNQHKETEVSIVWEVTGRSSAATPYTAIDTELEFALLPNPGSCAIPLSRDMGSSDGETTHDSQITQEAVPKSLGTSESSYTSVNLGPPLNRAEVFSSKLQD
ncbi:Uroplakin-3a, partial [Heterocephalus glaber]